MEEQPFPKISIVTPNFNGAAYLEETILSVVEQNYPNLEYIIIDGGSTDGSIEIIKKYKSKLAFWSSKPDKGQYDALNLGFSKSSGDILGWINSDDILHVNSLYTLAGLFKGNLGVEWIQGKPNMINEHSQFIYIRNHSSSKYSFYLKDYISDPNIYIQQESTFWKRSLWVKAGSGFDLTYQLAADFELWIRYFRYAELYCTDFLLGSFRKRVGQRSENIKLYISEANSIIDKEIKTLPMMEHKILAKIKKSRRINKFLKKKWPIRGIDYYSAKLFWPTKINQI